MQQKIENPQPVQMTARRLKAVEALIQEDSLESAAKAAGVNRTTLWRWLQEPEFQAAFRYGCKTLMESGLGKLQGYTERAVDTLGRALSADAEPGWGVRVRAATAILDRSLKAWEIMEIEERLRALEEALAATDSGARLRPSRPPGTTLLASR